MSDVADVNRAHLDDEPKDELDLYIHAARKLGTQFATPTDRLGFVTFHNVKNVARLGDRIDALRAENAALMEELYGGR